MRNLLIRSDWLEVIRGAVNAPPSCPVAGVVDVSDWSREHYGVALVARRRRPVRARQVGGTTAASRTPRCLLRVPKRLLTDKCYARWMVGVMSVLTVRERERATASDVTTSFHTALASCGAASQIAC